MWAMNSLTSLRLVSMAAAGSTQSVSSAAAQSRGKRSIGRRTLGSLGPNQLAMRMQRHENAEAGQQGDHGGAAIADHGQRHADHGQDAADHAGIDEHIHKEAE